MNILKNVATAFSEFLKKEVSRDIAFEFISLFHVQIQEPASMSDITRAFKQEVNHELSLCVVEHSHCGPSITGDTKICQCHLMKR